MAQSRQYWLFKSEPSAYSIDDLVRDKQTFWFGVRNYQARNFLRDSIRLGDRVLFYHSNATPMAIVGTAKVVKTGYPDHTAFDPSHQYFDPKSDPDNPRWFMVDIEITQKFPEPLTRDDLRANPATADMMLLRKGARLSIQPVTDQEWRAVHDLAGLKDK
jgi:predicted RNA-binding protein with PUA-like domain